MLHLPQIARWLTGLLLFLTAAGVMAGYSVKGSQILKDEQPVQLRGVNWFGLETGLHAPHGLHARNWREMIAQMKDAGINAVRVPVCPASLRGVVPGGIDYARNEDLQGLSSLEILDRLMDEFNRQGMHVLLDHHRPDCKAISELWYTDEYSEKDWLDDLVFMAKRYDDREYFMGIDIKNEPHGRATWGAGKRSTDWNRAAELAASQILKVSPHRLIFVEGVQETGRCEKNVPDAWWGGNLGAIRCVPLKIPASRLVLSPHVYGPDVHVQPYFNSKNFPENMPAIWDQHFGSLVEDGFAIVPGEFGGRYGHGGHPRDRIWQNAFVEYLRKRGITSGFYWSWNPNSGDTGGLLQDDWTTLWPTKLALLNHFWRGTGLASVPDVPPTTPPPVQSGDDERPPGPAPTVTRKAGKQLTYSVTELSDWGRGYCVDVGVRNTGAQAVDWVIRMPVDGRVKDLWNGSYREQGDRIEVNGVDWNRSLAPAKETHFGFCATRETQTRQPLATVTADNAQLSTRLKLHNRWDEGYCTDVIVSNGGSEPVEWKVSLRIEGRVNNLWRGRYEQNGSTLTVQGEHYNRTVAAGGEQSFGYCANLP